MSAIDFDDAFRALTGMTKPDEQPFPWQRALYADWFSQGKVPASCNLPTGLGKTSVIAVWLIALANGAKVPRRLVYVVNRRTVVDQTTDEVENLRRRLPDVPEIEQALWNLGAIRTEKRDPRDRPLAISTLRGQFADNREWSADPSRPAVISGTVDMIGSRLLFSGYGCGFKTRPLHAGFLGQDALVVHDEAHLEPAFQELLVAIEKEQARCNDFLPLKVMELTATSRGGEEPFVLTPDDYTDETVRKRINATKKLHLVPNRDEKKLAEEVADLALTFKDGGRAILVFVRKVEDVEKIVKKLPRGQTQQLTGTLRGLERDALVEDPVFRRFLPKAEEKAETVYLVCTSAGEVGVNISADHLVCDLSTFESMAQRFGRVNRFGLRDDTQIHVIHPGAFEEEDELQLRLKRTLGLLELLDGDVSPSALTALRERAVAEGSAAEPASSDRVQALRDYVTANQGADPRLGGFAPPPVVLPTSDILFDAWALTTVRDRPPGRPPVEPYLHGVAAWQPPETHVAWREEVGIITGDLLTQYPPEDLLEDYPLKPHELLRDRSDRVFKHLAAVARRHPDAHAWLVDDDGGIEVFTLRELADKDEKDRVENRTVLLPPRVGGLRDGLLDGAADETAGLDVADEWYADAARTAYRRRRVWGDDPGFDEKTEGMRRIRRIDFPAGDDEDAEGRSWFWFERPQGGDGEGSQANKLPVLWQVHTDDVVRNTTAIVRKLLPEWEGVFTPAAEYHDLGKKRKLFQTVLGNRDYPKTELAKSGKKGGRIEERYRHEFGSLIDTAADAAFQNLSDDMKDLVLHLIAAHHGRGRPHFPADEAFDPERPAGLAEAVAREVPRRFARLQRKYGRWGLAYLESLLRAADYAASAAPSAFVTEGGS